MYAVVMFQCSAWESRGVFFTSTKICMFQTVRNSQSKKKNANQYRLSLESHLSLCFTAGRNITGCYCGSIFYLDISRNFSCFQRTRALVKFLHQMTKFKNPAPDPFIFHAKNPVPRPLHFSCQEIFCLQPVMFQLIANYIVVLSLHQPIFQLHIWSHSRPKFGSFGHSSPCLLF